VRFSLSLSLPDLLSLFRLFVSPLIPLLGEAGLWGLSFLLVFAGALSDFLDGFLARRLGSSPLGKLLDPLADKVFSLCTLYAYTYLSPVSLSEWLFWLVLFRDGLLLLGGFLLLRKGVTPEPNLLGKLSTFFLFSLLFSCALSSALNRALPFLYPLEVLSGLLIVLSLFFYVREGLRHL